MSKICTHEDEGNDTERWNHMPKSLEPRKQNLVRKKTKIKTQGEMVVKAADRFTDKFLAVHAS